MPALLQAWRMLFHYANEDDDRDKWQLMEL
jgi:hypothetical protein